jgi:hypothetical protein
MSEESQGPGWWIASDGQWYAPHLHPSVRDGRSEAPEEKAPERTAPVTRPGTWLPSSSGPHPIQSPEISRPTTGRPTAMGSTIIPSVNRAHRRFGNWKVLAGLGGVIVAIVVSGSLVLTSSPARLTPTSVTHLPLARGPVSAPTTVPPAPPTDSLTSDWIVNHASPVQIVAMAKNIATSLWTTRNAALVAVDFKALARIETGSALQIDAYNLYLTECGCNAPSKPGSISSLQVLVPEQTAYPLDFLAAVQVAQASGPELMVFTKASAEAPWLVAFDTISNEPSQILPPQAPVVPGEPAGIFPPIAVSVGAQALQQMVSYLNTTATNDNNAPSQSTPFGSSPGAGGVADAFSPGTGTSPGPPALTYSSVASSPGPSAIWSFPATGMEPGATNMSCGTVQETTTSTATTSASLVQQGMDFGAILANGDYKAITEISGIETCVVSLSNGTLDDFGDSFGGTAARGTPAA